MSTRAEFPYSALTPTQPLHLLFPCFALTLTLPLPWLCPSYSARTLTLPLPLLFPYLYSALTLTLPPSGMVWIDCPWSSHSQGTMRASCPHLKMSLALKGLASPIKVLYDAYIHTHIALGKNDCDNSNGGDCSWRTDSVRIHCNFNKTPLVCSLSTYITAYILSLLFPFSFNESYELTHLLSFFSRHDIIRCSYREWIYQFGTCDERSSHCQPLESWGGNVNVLLKICCSGSVCVKIYVSVCVRLAFVFNYE